MALQPLDVNTRNVPPFAIWATLSSADPRPEVVYALAFYDRSLTTVALSVWSYTGVYLRLGSSRVHVPNGAEFWRVAQTLTVVTVPLQHPNMVRLGFQLAL